MADVQQCEDCGRAVAMDQTVCDECVRARIERDPELWLMRRQAETAAAIRNSPGGLHRWVGKVVKKGFPSARRGCHREWMWLKVVEVREGRLVGRLGNSPVYATYLSYGDEVVFDEDDIIAVMSWVDWVGDPRQHGDPRQKWRHQ